MAFRNGAYAKVWKVEPSDRFTTVQLSTSRKRKDTNEYETDFSSYVRFIGNAHDSAASLKEGDRIKLGECSCTRTWDREKQKEYINFQVFSFEPAESTQQTSRPSADTFNKVPSDAIDEELPFN